MSNYYATHMKGYDVWLSPFPFSSFLSWVVCHRMTALMHYGCHLHRPPRCPLDPSQTREQTRNWSMPKYSGKESKQYICWMDKRSEMPWCLKGSVVVCWSKVQIHSRRWNWVTWGRARWWLNVGCCGLLLYKKILIIFWRILGKLNNALNFGVIT